MTSMVRFWIVTAGGVVEHASIDVDRLNVPFRCMPRNQIGPPAQALPQFDCWKTPTAS